MEYALMNNLGEVQTVTLTEEHENNSDIYMLRIGDYNYTLEDIHAEVGVVLDANNQPVYLIDWQNQMIRSADGMEPEWDNTDEDDDDLPSWDDAPAPVPGHYGPGPEPDNLPNPATLFQEDDGPTLDEQLTDYNPATDIGHAVFYGEVYEIREVSTTTPFIYDIFGDLAGCITNDAPYFY